MMRYLNTSIIFSACLALSLDVAHAAGWFSSTGKEYSKNSAENILIKNMRLTKESAEVLVNIGYNPNHDAIEWQINQKNESGFHKNHIQQYDNFWRLIETSQSFLQRTSQLSQFMDVFNQHFKGDSVKTLITNKKDLIQPTAPSALPNRHDPMHNDLSRAQIEISYIEPLQNFIQQKYKQADAQPASHDNELENGVYIVPKSILSRNTQDIIQGEALNVLYLMTVQNYILDMLFDFTTKNVTAAQKIMEQITNIHGRRSVYSMAANSSEETSKNKETLESLEQELLKECRNLRNNESDLRTNILDLVSILKAPDVDISTLVTSLYQTFPVGENVEPPSSYWSYISHSLNGVWKRVAEHPRIQEAHNKVNPHLTASHFSKAYTNLLDTLIQENSHKSTDIHQIIFRRPPPPSFLEALKVRKNVITKDPLHESSHQMQNNNNSSDHEEREKKRTV